MTSPRRFSLYLPGGTSSWPQRGRPRRRPRRRGQNRSWTRAASPTWSSSRSCRAAARARWLVARTEIGTRLHRGVDRGLADRRGARPAAARGRVVVADRLARRIASPLRELAARRRPHAAKARSSEPCRRTGPPEVVAVAAALNRLAARVRQLLASERDAVADLSHRLRTPVTALRLDTEFVDDPDVARAAARARRRRSSGPSTRSSTTPGARRGRRADGAVLRRRGGSSASGSRSGRRSPRTRAGRCGWRCRDRPLRCPAGRRRPRGRRRRPASTTSSRTPRRGRRRDLGGRRGPTAPSCSPSRTPGPGCRPSTSSTAAVARRLHGPGVGHRPARRAGQRRSLELGR